MPLLQTPLSVKSSSMPPSFMKKPMDFRKFSAMWNPPSRNFAGRTKLYVILIFKTVKDIAVHVICFLQGINFPLYVFILHVLFENSPVLITWPQLKQILSELHWQGKTTVEILQQYKCTASKASNFTYNVGFLVTFESLDQADDVIFTTSEKIPFGLCGWFIL